MKAPEKIYISPLPNHSDGYVGVAWDEPHKTMVEYVRADAFIEKAISWLKEQNEMIGISFQEDFLERFQNYMKG